MWEQQVHKKMEKKFGFIYGITNDPVTIIEGQTEELLQSDVYLFRQIIKLLDKKWKSDLLFWDDFAENPHLLFTYDVLYIVWDPMSVFHWKHLNKLSIQQQPTNHKMAVQYERLLNRITCRMSPSIKMMKLMKHKGVYYEYLEDNNISTAPYFYIDRLPSLKMAEALWKKAKNDGWTKLIAKPSWGSCCTMVKCFELASNYAEFLKYADILSAQGYPGLTIQKFQKTASDCFEIRTFWIQGKYVYAIGTKANIYSAQNRDEEDGLDIIDISTFDDEKMKNGEFGRISACIRPKLIEVGQNVVKLPIFKDEFMIRIDFIKSDNDEYIVNEIEACWSRMFPENIDKISVIASAFVASHAFE